MTTHAKKIKTKPTWVNVEEKFSDIDRTGLMQLIADMYAADKINQSFLHTRFYRGGDPLDAYKKHPQGFVPKGFYP